MKVLDKGSKRRPAKAALPDRQRLQGTWEFVAGWREADLVIADDTFTVRFRNESVYRGTFRVDSRREPRSMDLRIVDGPAQFRGKTALAIYDLVGDMLRWCPATPGQDRPGAFPQEGDPKSLYIIFRRAKG